MKSYKRAIQVLVGPPYSPPHMDGLSIIWGAMTDNLFLLHRVINIPQILLPNFMFYRTSQSNKRNLDDSISRWLVGWLFGWLVVVRRDLKTAPILAVQQTFPRTWRDQTIQDHTSPNQTRPGKVGKVEKGGKVGTVRKIGNVGKQWYVE